MPLKFPLESAFMHQSKFYPKPKLKIQDAETTQRTKDQLQQLFVKYDSIISKHSADIGQTDLITITIRTPEGALPVVSKPYNLPLKQRFSERRN